MASNLKVDIVRPTATNGSLSLKGDSGGSATTNGVTVNSSGNTSITGTTTVSSLVATTADINGGTIDGAAIGGSAPAAGSFTQVNAGNGAEATPSITNTGDTDTGVYFPVANTIGVSTNGTERMRIDSSGNVGIGTTGTPSSKLHVGGDILIEDTGPVLKLKDSDSANATEFSGFIDFIDGTNTRAGYIGYGSASNSDFSIVNNSSGGDLDFRTNNTIRMRIDSSGDVITSNIKATTGQSLTIKDEDGNAAITIGTNSAAAGYLGLNFGSYHGDSGGAGSGTLSANTLDDYEEGTWTPTLSAGSGSITSYTSSGKYVKIGSVVFFLIEYSITDNGTGSGNGVVSNFPFNSSSGSTGVTRIGGTTGKTAVIYILPSSTSTQLRNYDNTYPWATGANGHIFISYFV